MGEVFAGRYEFLLPLAEGGMGTVWSVRDLKLGEIRAAKLLRQSDAASLLRFIREQSMRIDHAHVVTPLSWSGEDDRVLFTMPLIRGGSVATLLGDFGPLPASWVVAILDQTLQALEAVHAAGIIHRDVKPANLLLEPTGAGVPHVLLTDFGVALPVDEPRMTRTSQVFSTPGYTSDDQLRGADPDPRMDLYSVGTVGLEMLSAVRPPGAAEAALARAVQAPELRPLVDLLRRAASHEPTQRPASAAQLRVELAALGVPPVGPEDGPYVFTQVGPDGLSPAGDSAHRPVQLVTQRRTHPGPGGDGSPAAPRPRDRALAVALCALAVACVVAAGLLIWH